MNELHVTYFTYWLLGVISYPVIKFALVAILEKIESSIEKQAYDELGIK